MIASHIDKFLQRVPFFRLLLAFLFGIVFHSYYGFNISVFIISVFLGIILLLVGLLIKNHQLAYKLRWTFGVGIFFCLFALGMFTTNKKDSLLEFHYFDKQALFLCEIIDAPQEKQNSVMCEVKIQGVVKNKNISEIDAKAIIYFQKDSTSLYLKNGSVLLLNTTFNQPKSLGNPDEFDYAKYLRNKGIVATTFVSTQDWKQVGINDGFSFTKLAHQCRNKLLTIYENSNISGDEFAVLSALTLGYTNELSPEIRDSFSDSGAMHILSVSGLHVGIIYLVINFLFSFLDRNKKSRIIKNVFIILLLWLYAFITGLCPPVIRSALMLTLVCIGVAANRKSEIYNTIFISAFVMLLYNPYFLFDVGFQLSYLAVLSIIYFQPKFYHLWTIKNKFFDALWSLFTVSLAAQLGTTALCLFYFHQFSNYFWLTNMIVVPLSSLVIYLAVGLLFLNWIPYLNEFLADLLILLVKLMNGIVNYIHELPYAVIENIWLESSQFFLLFISLIFFTIAFVYRKYLMFVLAFASMLLFFLVNVYINYQTNESDKFIVAAMKKGYGVSFISQNKCYLMSDNTENEAKVMNNFRMRNRIEKTVLLDNKVKWYNDGFVSFNRRKIVVLSQDLFKNKTVESPLVVDYLVLTNNIKTSMSRVVQFVVPKKVIVDLSYPKWKTEKLKQECDKMGIDCYLIAQNGAYMEQF